MTTATEIWRGLSASALWIAGAPLMNYRAAKSDLDKMAARDVMARHCQRFLDRCRIRVELHGAPPVPGQGCVLSHNESSFPDLMAYMVTVFPHVDRAAAADIYKIFPFASTAFQKVGFEFVQRGNRNATDRLVNEMVARVRDGERLTWGGEGRLSGIDGVLPFKVGASLVAIRAGVPAIPVAIQGGHTTMPLKSLRARPGTIHIQFGDPVPTTGMAEENARDLADQLHRNVAEMYANLRNG